MGIIKPINALIDSIITKISSVNTSIGSTNTKIDNTNVKLEMANGKLGEIKSAILSQSVGGSTSAVAEMITDTIFYQKTDVTEAETLVFTETEINGVTTAATERFYANRLLFFSNDGEKAIVIKLYRNSTDYTEIVLNTGESISNLNMQNPVVTIGAKTTGDMISYRVMYGLAELGA